MHVSSDLETSLHRLQTQYFVDRNPSWVVLRYKAETSDGAGGIASGAYVNREAQRMRVVGQVGNRATVTADGRQVRVDKSLVGLDIIVEHGDVFTYEGEDYEIIVVQADPYWRVLAEAVRRA